MTASSIAKLFALAVVCGVIFTASLTAPALWWLSEADRAELLAQVEKTHGPAEAEYVRLALR